MSTAVKTAEQDFFRPAPMPCSSAPSAPSPPPTRSCRRPRPACAPRSPRPAASTTPSTRRTGSPGSPPTVEGLRQMHVWGDAPQRRRPLRRVRAADPRRRLRRVPRADRRRHPHEPARDRSAPRRWASPRPTSAASRTRSPTSSPPAARRTIKARLAELIAAQPNATTFGDTGLDETHAAIHEQMRKFSEAEVVPHAHEWHLKNEYIPLEIIGKVAELGVFGLTLPEEYGGLGARQGGDVRRLRGAVARLYRRRLARHALRDRGRADPQQRHGRAEGRSTCRRSRPARCCRPPCSPSPTPAPTSPRSRRAR